MRNRVLIQTQQQMVIHRLANGQECCTRKPVLVCPCGEYQIHWVPAPASSLAPLWERWSMEGLVPCGDAP